MYMLSYDNEKYYGYLSSQKTDIQNNLTTEDRYS